MFLRVLLHIMGRELGIKEINVEEDRPLCVARHAAFLSSASYQLAVATIATQPTQ